MSGPTAVDGSDRPLVGQEHYAVVAHCNHWFDGYTHALFKHHTASAAAVVGHFGIFVHLAANTMTCEFTHNAIPVALAKLLPGMANVAKMVASACSLNGKI
mgnify:CR=1 FL=1